MNSLLTEKRIRWNSADLELLPDGAHAELRNWSLETGLGESVQAPGLIFGDADNVIPDVVWISRERLLMGLD